MIPSASAPLQPSYLKKLLPLLEQLRGGLIVSCQAEANEPLHGAQHMAVMAVAAAQAGAAGIRANTPADIAAIRSVVSVPIIGIYKLDYPGFSVRVTPTLDSALEVAMAGADIIAVDATDRPHPDGLSLEQRLQQIHSHTDCPVMVDISTYAEGVSAQVAGADLVATTLSGYTNGSPVQEAPDFELLQRLVASLKIPVVAEGRIATPEQAAQAIALGAFAVVVGSAITRPKWITERFIKAVIGT
jgi:N-acylglucosamine-6-phosphate 2-epimerase